MGKPHPSRRMCELPQNKITPSSVTWDYYVSERGMSAHPHEGWGNLALEGRDARAHVFMCEWCLSSLRSSDANSSHSHRQPLVNLTHSTPSAIKDALMCREMFGRLRYVVQSLCCLYKSSFYYIAQFEMCSSVSKHLKFEVKKKKKDVTKQVHHRVHLAVGDSVLNFIVLWIQSIIHTFQNNAYCLVDMISPGVNFFCFGTNVLQAQKMNWWDCLDSLRSKVTIMVTSPPCECDPSGNLFKFGPNVHVRRQQLF